ncbi:MAG: hypothetical protein KDA86_20000 [Planctomycetaceae bacterium]|nr:hypothetical protein [Planctomycetaceae bacterium]
MPSETDVQLTRQELYEHVWSTPLRTLASEWGLYDVGLAKICDRHSIPRPAAGHWAKKRHGKRVRRTPLPKVVDGDQETIRISSTERVEGPSVIDSEIAELILREKDTDRAIVVGEQTQIRHPTVNATRQSLKGRRPNEYGRVSPDWQFTGTHFDVQVSPQNVQRSLRILQCLTAAMQTRGFPLKEKGDKNRHPCFDVMGEEFRVSMREGSKRSKREQKEPKRGIWHSERYDYTPTGILELRINDDSYSSDATLRDTKKKSLESRLNEAIIAMLRIVDRRRIQREIRRLEEIEKAERKKIAVEQEIERRSDSARVSRLKTLTEQWETHRRFSAFVNAVRAEVEARAPAVDPDTVDWLTWADAFLREIDPICGGEDLPVYSLTDEEREQLRRECESDWNQWSGTFTQRDRHTGSEPGQFRPRKPR